MRFVALTALLLSACVHQTGARDTVLANPAAHDGRAVRLCGVRVDGANIVESYPYRPERPGGISIADSGPLGRRTGRVCVEGVIARIGCATGPDLCTDASFDYAIRITRVVR